MERMARDSSFEPPPLKTSRGASSENDPSARKTLALKKNFIYISRFAKIVAKAILLLNLFFLFTISTHSELLAETILFQFF